MTLNSTGVPTLEEYIQREIYRNYVKLPDGTYRNIHVKLVSCQGVRLCMPRWPSYEQDFAEGTCTRELEKQTKNNEPHCRRIFYL